MQNSTRNVYPLLAVLFALVGLFATGRWATTAVAAQEDNAPVHLLSGEEPGKIASPQIETAAVVNSELLLVPPCYVETTGDNITDYTSVDASALQTAVNAAASNDLIKVAGTCAGVQMQGGISQTVYIAKNLTLQGGYTTTNWLATPNPDTYPTVLDAQDNGRVIYIPNSNYQVTIDSLTIQNGYSSGDGGGIWTSDTLTLTNSVVQDSYAGDDGGGVMLNTGSVGYVSNSIFRNNTTMNASSHFGGGLYLTLGVMTIDTSSFYNNGARGGGGVANIEGTMTIMKSAIYDNVGYGQAGGINSERGTLYLINSTVSQNSSSNAGGVLNFSSNAGLTGTLVMTNANVVNNTGSGIRTLDNGGPARTILYNSMIADNSNAECNTSGTDSQVDASPGYNLDSDGSCVTNGVDNNITADPNLGPLQDNGGDTPTHALLTGSPALDYIPASVNGCGTTVTTDQRGLARYYGSGCDIGAFEYVPDLCYVSLNNNNSTDYVSVDASALQTAVTNANANDLLKIAGTCAGVQTQGGQIQTVYINKNLTLQGGYTTTNWLATPDPDTYPTILDAEDNGRVIYIPNSNYQVTIDSLTIQNGYHSTGDGGGIWTRDTLTLTNSIVQDSYAGDDGGGIYFDAGVGYIANSTIRNNSIATTSGSFGAGVYSALSTVTIDNSAIYSNTGRTGGGMSLLQSVMTISNSAIYNNTGTVQGGGLNSQSATLYVINSTISQNSSPNGAGIISAGVGGVTATLVLTQTTVASNTGAHGVRTYSPSGPARTTFYNSIVANNGNTECNVAGTDSQLDVSHGYNLDSDGSCVTDGVDNNITANPNLGSLQDNGGDTPTHALLVGSPALDQIPAGVNGCGTTITTDQRGFTRPEYAQCDIGAYENETNFPPVASDDTYVTAEEVALTVGAPGVLSNDSDGNDDSITAALQTDPTNGTLTFSNDGSFIYTPTVNFAGVDTFTYIASDGTLTDTAVVNITVNNVNDAPVATNDAYNTTEDTPLAITAPGVLSNDSDLDGDGLTAVLDTDVTNGTLTLNSNGSFTYMPDNDSCGQDSFTYHANDGQADSNTAAVTIDVSCVNDAPVANADSYNTVEDTLLTIAAAGVLTNDTDIEGDGLTAVLNTSTLSGTLSLNSDGSFDYTPDADFCGLDSFTYHANDGQADSNAATVTIDVTCVNDAPNAGDDNYSVTEDSVDNILTVLLNDNDGDGDVLSLTAVTPPNNGSAMISGTVILYSPDINFVGMDVFTYTVSDGVLTDSAVVTLSIDNENDPPTAVDDSYAVNEDSSDNVLNVLSNDSDIDVGDVLSLTAVSSPGNGTATISGTVILYTSLPDFFGTDVFSYTISDGALTDTAVVTVTVSGVNDAPTAVDDSYAVAEDSSANGLNVLSNDSDIDVGDVLSITAVSAPNYGTATISGTVVLYTPFPDFFGTDVFSYTISDGALADMAVVTVTVNGINDAPTAVDDSYTVNEDSSDNVLDVLNNDSDIDLGDSLSITAVSLPNNGTATISGTVVLYTPSPDFFGTDVFSYTISDGALADTALVTVTVGGVNKPPTAVDDTYTIDENSSDNVLDVLANDSDFDGDSLTIVSVGAVGNGTAVISGTSILYTPTPDFVGTSTFTYTISDGDLTATASVTITVTPVQTGFAIYLPFLSKP